MSTLLQVWTPFVQGSPIDAVWLRDLQRAQQAWRGEVRIWLKPRPRQNVRWSNVQNGLRIWECIVHSERLNSITVHHVDDGRRLYPVLGTPTSPLRELPTAFYAQWLAATPSLYEVPREFLWKLPRVEDGQVVMKTARITTAPGAVIPATEVEIIGNRLRMTNVWPPREFEMAFPISPEGESARIYGKLAREYLDLEEGPVDVVTTELDPKMVALPLAFKWPVPFDALFPLGGGTDLLLHQALMRQCIEDLTGGRRAEVLRTVEGWVQQLTGEVESTIEQAWFLPRLMVNAETALFDVEGRFGLSATTLAELAAMPRFKEEMSRRINVRRVHSWLGYFWWELYQDVLSNMTVHCCEQCGTIFRGGHADKRFCSRTDNPACWQQRNASEQRSVRRSNKSRKGPAAKGRGNG